MHDAWAWNRYLSKTGPEKVRNAHAMPMPPLHDQASPRILIADDDSTMRTMLLSGLTRLGYQVVVANNGDQAWELLQRPDAPEIAILDWLMPGVTGIELCRRLRERKALPYTYVILLTGMDTLDDLVTGKVSAEKGSGDLGKLSVFAGVCKFPSRVKCAALCWHTLQGALGKDQEPVSTE